MIGMSDISAWPVKLTREQQKAAKQRRKDFDAALKREGRAAGWQCASGAVFRQFGDWFVSLLPSLLWERGAVVRMIIKPMALDPLFWDIAGLKENEEMPLSFRATGAWVLRPRSTDDHIGLHIVEVEPLATEVLRWCSERASEILENVSVQSMLAAIPDRECPRGQERALAICLHILAEDLDGAIDLCRTDDPDAHPMMREGGGFTTHNPDGTISTFLDQASDWIARERRNKLHAV